MIHEGIGRRAQLVDESCRSCKPNRAVGGFWKRKQPDVQVRIFGNRINKLRIEPPLVIGLPQNMSRLIHQLQDRIHGRP